MNYIGIDIGTTTLSAVAVRAEDGEILSAVTRPSVGFLPSAYSYEKAQDASWILSRAEEMLSELIASHPPVCSIGVTGQMHGIVYLDAAGCVCSPLYTWQDTRAAQVGGNGSALEEIRRKTGYSVSAGYGIATHLYNLRHGLVPAAAKSFSTIHDALTARLCGLQKAVMHTSDAASLGVFDLSAGAFDEKALVSLGIDPSFLPCVTAETVCAGEYRGIPVSVAIGDNQASFLGTVADTDGAVLCNVGTGSQISVVTDRLILPQTGEIRPLADGKYILCGCSLCGGRSLSLLERFFRQTAAALGMPDEPQYAMIDRLAQAAVTNPIRFETTFCGTREDPTKTASVTGLTEDNFTPTHFVQGVLSGIADELYGYYRAFGGGTQPKHLYGSGNGIRRNPALCTIFENLFGAPMRIPANKEEAAFGAALFGAAASGVCTLSAAQRLIRY